MGAADFDSVAAELDAFLHPESDPKQARKREQILRAATDLFIAYGYRKTTIDDVAGAAGVAKGTVYLYYENKAELLLHAIGLQKQQYLAELAPLLDGSLPPLESLRALIVAAVTLSHEMPLLARFTGGDHEIEQVLQDVDAATLAGINASRIHFVAGLIDAATERSLPKREVHRRAAVLLDLVFAVANGGRMIRDGMALQDYARTLADMIVGGIAA